MDKYALILLLIFTYANNVTAEDCIVMERKILHDKNLNCSDIYSTEVFIDDDNDILVLVEVRGVNAEKILYVNNSWTRIDKYGSLLNGFVENGRMRLVFTKDGNIVIYDIQEGFDTPIESIEINVEFPQKFIAVPQMTDKHYILYTEEKFTPLQFFSRVLTGGHSSGCAKPYLAEVQKGEISQFSEIRYGGKRIEDFFIKEIVSDAKMIHCLGFRQQIESDGGFPPLNSPYILYYAGYDLKKNKVTQNHNVYEINYDSGSYNFGPLSMVSRDDNIFIVFSFHKYPFRGAPQNDIKQITSDIYYFEYSKKTVGDTVQIAKGFAPLVKVDSFGDVHVLWINSDGNLVHKAKKDGKWNEEKIVLDGVDIYPNITVSRYFSAEFDNKDNLHVVYPSGGNLIHSELKFN